MGTCKVASSFFRAFSKGSGLLYVGLATNIVHLSHASEQNKHNIPCATFTLWFAPSERNRKPYNPKPSKPYLSPAHPKALTLVTGKRLRGTAEPPESPVLLIPKGPKYLYW